MYRLVNIYQWSTASGNGSAFSMIRIYQKTKVLDDRKVLLEAISFGLHSVPIFGLKN